jgi:hypothetical protein
MSIIDDFVKEEINEYSTKVIVNAIEKGKANPDICKDELTFNRYNIVINFEDKTITIQDEFDPSQRGEISLGFDEFLRAICK